MIIQRSIGKSNIPYRAKSDRYYLCEEVISLEQLMKVIHVAEILNISSDRVYNLSREQIIPSVRVGRSLRFSYKAIDEFIATGGKGLPGGWKRNN